MTPNVSLRAFPFALALLALAVLIWPGPEAHAQSGTDPEQAAAFIVDLGNETIEIVRADLPVEEKVEAFRDVFREGFDIVTVGRFVLGRHWRTATEAQQREYLRLFETLTVETYARRFSDYSGQDFEITGTRPEGDRDAMVSMRIAGPGGPPLNVNWRVREANGEFKIIDVVVEGISQVITQRQEFSAVIQQAGGNVDALINQLRDRLEAVRGA